MTKSAVDSLSQAYLNELINLGDQMNVCYQAPTSYTEAVVESGTGFSIGVKTLTLSEGQGTYTSADGDSSGRKVTVAQQTSITMSYDANANHIAIVSTANSALLIVTSLTSQAVVAGNSATVSAFDLEVRDPT